MSAGLSTDLALGCCALFVDPCSDVGSAVVLHGEVRRSQAAGWHIEHGCWKREGLPGFTAGVGFTLTGRFGLGGGTALAACAVSPELS